MIHAELASYLPGFIAAYLILLVGSLSPGPQWLFAAFKIATSES